MLVFGNAYIAVVFQFFTMAIQQGPLNADGHVRQASHTIGAAPCNIDLHGLHLYMHSSGLLIHTVA